MEKMIEKNLEKGLNEIKKETKNINQISKKT